MKILTLEQCRYLGIAISTNTSQVYLKRQMRKLYANVKLLVRTFSKCSVDVRCVSFKTYCFNLYCTMLQVSPPEYKPEPEPLCCLIVPKRRQKVDTCI